MTEHDHPAPDGPSAPEGQCLSIAKQMELILRVTSYLMRETFSGITPVSVVDRACANAFRETFRHVEMKDVVKLGAQDFPALMRTIRSFMERTLCDHSRRGSAPLRPRPPRHRPAETRRDEGWPSSLA